jgi:DNA adenine methylase
MTLLQQQPPTTATTLPPPLKWAGGKRWLLPVLREYWLKWSGRRLVEPFCGGLAVALGLNPKQALLNDINPHVIHFYHHLQQGLFVDEVFHHSETTYYQLREHFNTLIATEQAHTREAALCFYYLNRTGYNGLCRFNRKGFFNVPFGQYKTIRYIQDFSAYQPVLSPWVFCCGDFETLDISPHDVLYADPPYDVEFVSYSAGGFTWDDQVRLAHWLARQPCPVIASNQATPRIVELYRHLGFQVSMLDAPRRIACTGNRSPAREMLAIIGKKTRSR